MRKISFPKYIVVVSATVSALINLAINLVVVLIFTVINGVEPSLGWLMVPVFILELYVLALSLAFLLGAINVKFHDIASIWEVIVQAMFYAVPIIYPISMVTTSFPRIAGVMLMNPIAQIIQDTRFFLVTDQTVTVWNYIENPFLRIVPIAIILVLAIFAAIYFRRRSKYFAEEA